MLTCGNSWSIDSCGQLKADIDKDSRIPGKVPQRRFAWNVLLLWDAVGSTGDSKDGDVRHSTESMESCSMFVSL